MIFDLSSHSRIESFLLHTRTACTDHPYQRGMKPENISARGEITVVEGREGDLPERVDRSEMLRGECTRILNDQDKMKLQVESSRYSLR